MLKATRCAEWICAALAVAVNIVGGVYYIFAPYRTSQAIGDTREAYSYTTNFFQVGGPYLTQAMMLSALYAVLSIGVAVGVIVHIRSRQTWLILFGRQVVWVVAGLLVVLFMFGMFLRPGMSELFVLDGPGVILALIASIVAGWTPPWITHPAVAN